MITSGPIPSPAIAAILCARIVPPLPIGARNGYRARVSAAYISADKERKRVRAPAWGAEGCELDARGQKLIGRDLLRERCTARQQQRQESHRQDCRTRF